MYEQWPTKKLTLFRSLEGYVEHFYLANTKQELHPYYATDFRYDTNALINLQISGKTFTQYGFTNKGSIGGQFQLSGEKRFEDVFFRRPSEGSNLVGTLSDSNRVFDGIACNDRHMTTQLDSPESYIRFYTPPF